MVRLAALETGLHNGVFKGLGDIFPVRCQLAAHHPVQNLWDRQRDRNILAHPAKNFIFQRGQSFVLAPLEPELGLKPESTLKNCFRSDAEHGLVRLQPYDHSERKIRAVSVGPKNLGPRKNSCNRNTDELWIRLPASPATSNRLTVS